MALMNFRDVCISFGSHPLLDKASLTIEERERICILGRNGTGKSTLLKVLDGTILPDSGEINKQNHVVIARLEQDVPASAIGTIYEVITAGLGERGKLLSRYQKLTAQLTVDATESVLNELQKIQHALDKYQAWDLSHKVDSVITRLNLAGDQQFSDLSGGLKRRVLLGQALVLDPHILLLDEPTNHLDIEAITWLENFLLEFNGTVIFITHDRTFLQRLATRIIELDRGKLQNYPCNYQQYVERKQHELEIEATHNQLFDKKLAQEEVWIRQGIKARRTRNEGRVRELEKLREVRASRREVMGKVNMQLQQAEQSGKLVVEAEHISFTTGNRRLIDNFSTTIIRGDKIGMIGPNGIGKTTLLKILLGQLEPQKGKIKQGTKLEVAYFDQLRAQLDENKSVADNVSYGDQHVMVNGKSTHIIGYLQDFLFAPDRARTPVKSLSGGERNRLLLARLFSKPSNVLVMDEPTNDLDLETLELLEDLLMNYEGTLLIVSHDRSFLNNIVTSTIVFEGNGKIQEYIGGYDDWLRQRPTFANVTPPLVAAEKKTVNKVNKPSVNQQKEARALELKIEKLEEKQATLQHQLADATLYEASQISKLTSLQDNLQKIAQELTTLYKKWESVM